MREEPAITEWRSSLYCAAIAAFPSPSGQQMVPPLSAGNRDAASMASFDTEGTLLSSLLFVSALPQDDGR